MDFIQKILAQLLDKFKVANPVVFAVIVAVLTSVKILIDNGTIPLPQNISQWVLWAIAIVLNAGTFKVLNPDKK